MTENQIQHYLVVYTIAEGVARVEEFGQDYPAALEAYAAAEARFREDDDTEVVLLGSDSLGTLKRTHSSYFELDDRHVDRVVAKDLAELGLG